MRKFIHIRGSMGSGKTTAVRQFLQRTGGFTLHQISVQGKMYPYHYNKERRILITGMYGRRTCDGCDGVIKNKEVMREYLLRLLDTVKPDCVIFEAVMYGVTAQFTLKLIEELEPRGYSYVGIALVPPFEVTLSRVLTRNGGKRINVKALKSKYMQALRSAERLQREGVNIQMVDSSQVRMNNMDMLIEKELSNEVS